MSIRIVAYTPVKHRASGKCPACLSTDVKRERGRLVVRKGKYGEFLGCSRYPQCKYTTKK